MGNYSFFSRYAAHFGVLVMCDDALESIRIDGSIGITENKNVCVLYRCNSAVHRRHLTFPGWLEKQNYTPMLSYNFSCTVSGSICNNYCCDQIQGIINALAVLYLAGYNFFFIISSNNMRYPW